MREPHKKGVAHPVPRPITGLLACAFSALIWENWMIYAHAETLTDKKSS